MNYCILENELLAIIDGIHVHVPCAVVQDILWNE